MNKNKWIAIRLDENLDIIEIFITYNYRKMSICYTKN